MKNKKIFIGILIVVIIIVIYLSLWFMQRNQNVTITTDKAEYEQGEIIKIAVRNGLDKLIWYNARTCPPFCWALQKLKNGEWRNISIAIEVVFDLPVSPSSLEPNGQLTRNWDMSIMEDGSQKIAETGVYRLFFDYGLSRDSYTDKTIYSNEFTIKYESGNPIIRCGGESCKCMKEKECEPPGGVYFIPIGEGECSANSDNKICCCPGV